MTKVFFMFFFLINGTWQPATNYEGWAVREAGQSYEATDIEKKEAICELGIELTKENNKKIQATPEGANFPGVKEKVHGVFMQCMTIKFPQ